MGERVHMRSCDEAFLELPEIEVLSWAEALRSAVYKQTRCTCSIGIGRSQVVAKLAGKACKPDGAKWVTDDSIKTFIAEVPLGSLPQIGRAMVTKLEQRSLKCCCDIWKVSRTTMQSWFGKKGEMLWAW